MSAGLDASTVTPGSTAPDASFVTPPMLAAPATCAAETRGETAMTAAMSVNAKTPGGAYRRKGVICPPATYELVRNTRTA